MAFTSRRAGLAFGDDVQARLERIVRSPSESARHVERARILLNYAAGKSVSAIARELRTNRPKVERCIDKGLQLGALSALGDLPRKGRPGTIPAEARAWVVSLACVKPKDLGYLGGTVDDPVTGESCSRALRAGGSPESGEAGTRHGVEDPGGSQAAAAQDRVLPGETRSGIRHEDGPSAGVVQTG